MTTYNPMTGAYKADPAATSCDKRIVFAGNWLQWAYTIKRNARHLHERLGTQEISGNEADALLDEVRKPQTGPEWTAEAVAAGEDEQHAPDCMIWQIDAAADRGDGFPEPEDVACTCGLVERRHENLGARFTISGGEVLQIDPTEPSDEEIPF